MNPINPPTSSSPETQVGPAAGNRAPAGPPNRDVAGSSPSEVEQHEAPSPEERAKEREDVKTIVTKAVERAASQAASERWNRLASWVLFAGGIGLVALWTGLLLALPDAQMPAPGRVVMTGMILGGVCAITGATLLMIASFKPAVGVRAAVEALEAQKRLERMTAETEVALLEVEAKRREFSDRQS